MYRKIRFFFAVLILATLAAPAIAIIEKPVERTQTVYSILDWNGNPIETSVVNWLRVSGDVKVAITDNPELDKINILDSESEPERKDAKLIWNTDGNDDIYYTGETTKPLPVQIKTTFTQNGKVVKPEDVGGSGELKVDISLTNNLSKQQTISWTEGDQKKSITKQVFYPMTVMAQLAIEVKDFKEIVSDSAISLVVGGTARYTWTAFPKPDDSISFVIKSDKLILPELQISILPKTPAFELPTIDKGSIDILGSFGSDSDLLDMIDMDFNFDSVAAAKNIDQLTQLLDGVKTAVDAADEGLGGLSKLLSGYASNFGTMNDGIDGLKQLSEGHKQVIDMMKSQFDQNTAGMGEIVTTLQSSSDQSSRVSREVFKIKAMLEDIGDQVKQVRDKTTDQSILSICDDIEMSRKSALGKIDPIKSDSDKTSTNLKTLIDGGTINGKQVPSMSTLPDQLKLLGDTLTALSTGGKIMENDLPGLNTTIDGLKGVSDGLNLIVKGGKVESQTVPAFADIPKLLSQATDGLNMLVDGGTFEGQEIPPQTEIKKMIADFKKQLENMPDTKKLGQTMEKVKTVITKAGGSEKVMEAMDKTKKLVYQDQAEFDAMKQLGVSYDSFIGNTDNAISSVIFVIKFDEKSASDINAVNNKHYNPEKSIMDNDINKYKYILLIVAIVLIIAAFPINWLFKKRYGNK
jgi:methyl-accepting chemotaxis protein